MEVWIAIVGSGIATFATRALPLVADIRIPERGRLRRYLDDLPTSIIAALAGAAVLAPDQRLAIGPEIPAAVVTIAVARWRRNLLLAVLAGVTTIALLRTILA
jgi:branched-subunit amino acid transport protein